MPPVVGSVPLSLRAWRRLPHADRATWWQWNYDGGSSEYGEWGCHHPPGVMQPCAEASALKHGGAGRLQQSEAQMLKQIDDARVSQRRAETHLAKAQEQNASLRTELAELRQRAHRDQQALAAAHHTLATVQSRLAEAEALATDRERALITQTAHAEAAQRVISTLEAALQRPRRVRPQPPAI